MIHPDTEVRFINDLIGYGLFAKRFIPKGTLVWTLCHLDKVMSPYERAALPQAYAKTLGHFAYPDVHGNTILCWDGGRYINHSCAPAMLPLDVGYEIAVRDIQPDEELTCDYSELNLDEELRCYCGHASCRGSIKRNDIDGMWQEWDAQVRSALQLAASVAQPLLPFARHPESVQRYLSDPSSLPSHKDFYTSTSGSPA